jgi:hypothetical protein
MGRQPEVVVAIAFLNGPGARYVTGQCRTWTAASSTAEGASAGEGLSPPFQCYEKSIVKAASSSRGLSGRVPGLGEDPVVIALFGRLDAGLSRICVWLAGIDDVAAHLSPSLTTVHIPAAGPGVETAATMVHRLQSPGRNPSGSQLPIHQVARHSSGP